MTYKNITEGTFLSRPNRFIARVDIDGRVHTVHVKNTGRCKEILKEGARVFLTKSDNPLRKTEYDLVAAEKETENGTLLINIDSQIPNAAAEEFLHSSSLFSPDALIRREVTYGNSRFDLFIEDKGEKIFMEVKGVTLEKDGAALFPDAPTVRGIKHINELIRAKEEGFGAYILFIIQMKGVHCFSPNKEMHPEFAAALKNALKAGVNILAFDCEITKDSVTVKDPVKTII